MPKLTHRHLLSRFARETINDNASHPLVTARPLSFENIYDALDIALYRTLPFVSLAASTIAPVLMKLRDAVASRGHSIFLTRVVYQAATPHASRLLMIPFSLLCDAAMPQATAVFRRMFSVRPTYVT